VVENVVVYVTSEFNTLSALSTSDGHELWDYQGGNSVGPVVDHGVVYVETGASFYAFSARDGHQLWHVQSTSGFESTPTVVNGVVYLADFENVYAFSTSQMS
jgi:outer membrane protein assembly factor BamB